jgi:hexosaminidase
MMQKAIIAAVWAGALLHASSVSAAAETASPLPLIPMPASVTRTTGGVSITNGAGVVASDAGATTAARLLINHVRTTRGLELRPATNGAVRLERDASVVGEGAYRLEVSDAGVRITASTDSGLLYGAMTLAQLLSPDTAFGQPVAVPAMVIEDRPAYRWRGYMADVARHYQPVSALKTSIDQMAALKLNVLHLHLSDDQGWRIEIKRYPELTRIGAWRTTPSAGNEPPKRYGGFYTQDEMRDLVAYAAARGVTIVPEIDLPGHAQAIVASYPELGVFGDRPPVSGDWGVNPYLLDPGPDGIAFVKAVLDEIMDIFPGQYIHLGGDEAIKDQWKRSPRVQALMREQGIATENALQSALIREFDAYLRAHDRVLIGWDEILEGGGLPQSAAVMSWQGEKGAIEASAEGHDVVLSPAPILYLDNIQSWLPGEPPMRPANPAMTLERVYGYDPMPQAIAPADRHHVLGAQMNAWSEYLSTPALVWHATFPRLAAFADNIWSGAPTRDFPGFLDRLEPQMARWKRAGVPAADSAFAVGYTLQGARSDAVRSGQATVALASQTGQGVIRYTLDGSEPSPTSAAYAQPLTTPLGVTIRATSFGAGDQALAAPRTYEARPAALLTADVNALSACMGGIELRLPLDPDSGAVAPAYNANIFDDCMNWRNAPLSVAKGFDIEVARLPYNFGIANDFKRMKHYFAATQFGELIVRAGGCEGTPVGTFPLPDPAAAPVQMRFAGPLPAGLTDSDLCMTFTSPIGDYFYAVGGVTLEAAQ